MTMKEKKAQSNSGESAYFPKSTIVAKYMKSGRLENAPKVLAGPVRVSFARALRGFVELHERTELLLDEHEAVDRAALAALRRTRVLLSQ